MLPTQRNKLSFLLGPIPILLLATTLGCLIAFFVASYRTQWSPEAREQAFQSELAECERLVELNGNDWHLKLGLDNTCVAVFEEYSRRVDEKEKQQAIDKTEKQGISDSAASEPPDIE